MALRLYNQQNQLVQSWVQPAPVVNATSWQSLRFLVTPDLSGLPSRAGYLEVQLLNDGSQPVYFDSLTVRHPKDAVLVTQENHYYPLGLALTGVAVNTQAQPQASKALFNGGANLEDDVLGDAGIYSTFYRTYDPALGRFQGVDPLAAHAADWSPYQFALGNPLALNDPTGAVEDAEDPYGDYVNGGGGGGRFGGGGGGGFGGMDGGNRGYGGSPVNDWPTGIFGGGPGTSGLGGGGSQIAGDWNPGSSAALRESVQQMLALAYGTAIWGSRQGETGIFVDNSYDDGHEVFVISTFIKIAIVPSADELDPGSINHNIFWLSYPGGNNPRTYAGKYSYSYVPTNPSEYPAIGHDRRYDNLHVEGANGLFTDQRAIGADYRFVAEEYATATQALFTGHFLVYGQSMSLATGLGLAASFKTIIALIDPNFGITGVATWYEISNQGVNNTPSK